MQAAKDEKAATDAAPVAVADEPKVDATPAATVDVSKVDAEEMKTIRSMFVAWAKMTDEKRAAVVPMVEMMFTTITPDIATALYTAYCVEMAEEMKRAERAKLIATFKDERVAKYTLPESIKTIATEAGKLDISLVISCDKETGEVKMTISGGGGISTNGGRRGRPAGSGSKYTYHVDGGEAMGNKAAVEMVCDAGLIAKVEQFKKDAKGNYNYHQALKSIAGQDIAGAKAALARIEKREKVSA